MFTAIRSQLDRIERLLNQLILQGAKNMSQLDTAIAALTAQVAAETTVEQSAVTLINGIPALIASAVATATAAGATPVQLAAITALGTSIQTSSTSLASAVTANTQPAPPAPAPASP